LKILVLGAGAWGTALASNAAARHEVVLWARDPAQARAMAAQRENRRYLPGIRLPDSLAIRGAVLADVPALAAASELTVIASPLSGLRELLGALREYRGSVAWLCKGLEPAADGGGLLGHEVKAQAAPELKAGVLSGPSFAEEVAHSLPTALVAASAEADVRQALVVAFHSGNLRVYANDDLAGVEIGGAVKNVLAIATGLCDGLRLGNNARAALITRGLAEMTRLGVNLGARPETFMGLSGLGDLVLTATGDLSRNRRVGQLLATGKSLAEILQSLGHVAEGVHCARAIAERASRAGVEMPIVEAVVQLLGGEARPQEVLAALMGREAKQESQSSMTPPTP
jgi:glycerol-3-phosphate dehydrogenase (NAD(P)+)